MKNTTVTISNLTARQIYNLLQDVDLGDNVYTKTLKEGLNKIQSELYQKIGYTK